MAAPSSLRPGLKYSTHLVGVNGFDPFIKRSEEVLKSTLEVSTWFKKVALIYETNGKALLKSANLSKKKKTSVCAVEIGTLDSAWRSFHVQLEEIGNAQLTCARDLQNEVADKITSFVTDKTNVRKKLVGEATKVTTELKNVIAGLQKSRSNYESKCKDADSAQQAYLKAKQDSNIKPKKVQELHSRFTKTLDVAIQAEKEYQKTLEKANEKQNRHYETEMPSILEMFQALEEERLNFLKDMFSLAAAIQNSLPPVYAECVHQMISVSQDMTAMGDIQEYIEENSASVVPPTPLEFVPYETDNPSFQTSIADSSSKTTTTADPQGDEAAQYGLSNEEESKLSNQEKVQKLQGQLSELREAIKAETSSQKGMEKLVKFYAKDPKSQEKAKTELEEQIKKIEGMKSTKDSVEKSLLDLDSSIPLPVEEEDEAEEASQPNNFPKARALYPYAATNESELSFKEGDILLITEQDESGWWFANLNGRAGFIPKNYVNLL